MTLNRATQRTVTSGLRQPAPAADGNRSAERIEIAVDPSYTLENRVSALTAFDAVLYAKDLSVMTTFYRRVLEITAVAERQSIVELRLGASRLVLHAIPAHIAGTFTIEVPPVRREEAAIKLSFEVASLLRVRAAAAEVGGTVDAVEREWEAGGRRYVDGVDPEGNVLQFHVTVRPR